jgi:hypothetical protein
VNAADIPTCIYKRDGGDLILRELKEAMREEVRPTCVCPECRAFEVFRERQQRGLYGSGLTFDPSKFLTS